MDSHTFLQLLSQLGVELDDSRAQLLTQMLTAANPGAAPQATVEERLAKKKKVLAQLENLLQENRQLLEENRKLWEKLDGLAEALGACAECWGEDPACRRCRGRGRPGYYLPDTDFLLGIIRALPPEHLKGAGEARPARGNKPEERQRGQPMSAE